MRARSKKLFVYKIIAFAFALLLFIMPGNVSSLPDGDLRVIATTLGLDFDNGETVAYAYVMVPSQSSPSNYATAEGRGSGIAQAINNLAHSIGRKVEFGQCELVVLGKNLVENGTADTLDYLLASDTVGTGSALIYTQSVGDFIKGSGKLSSNMLSGINSYVLSSRTGIYIPSMSLLNCISAMKSGDGCTYLPLVNIKAEEKKGGEQADSGGEKSAAAVPAQSGGAAEEEKATIDSFNTAVMLKDGRLSKTLDENQTRGITWLDKRSERGHVQIESFNYDGVETGAVSAQLKSKSVKIKARFNDGMPTITLKLKCYMSLDDSHVLNGAHGTRQHVAQALKLKFEELVANEIAAAVMAVRGEKADFLGFKTELNRYCHKQLKEFDANPNNDFYRDLKIEYDVNIRVK